jgi:formyl-CoA transferase
MNGPLQGIRVVDVSQMWAAPGCAMYLADQGADVIKVEPPRGDQARAVFTLPAVNGESRAFWMVNRNKRGIALDLRKPEGRAALLRLCAGADVFIHNYRPGVDARLGADEGAIRAVSPRVVYAALSPYGQAGPYRDARGYDLLLQAASGILGRRSMPDGSPRGAGLWAVDTGTSIMMAYAIALALFQRERTGQGRRVDASMLSTAVALQMVELVKPLAIAEEWDAQDLGTQAVYSAYRCSDRRFIQLAVVTDAEFGNLCRALGREALAADPRFATAGARAAQSGALAALLAEAFGRRDSRAWSDETLRHDVPAMAVVPPQEVFETEQAKSNGVFVAVEQPGAGPTLMMSPPFRISGPPAPEPAAAPRPAPRLGEHTDALLREAGFTPAEIAALRRARAVK